MAIAYWLFVPESGSNGSVPILPTQYKNAALVASAASFLILIGYGLWLKRLIRTRARVDEKPEYATFVELNEEGIVYCRDSERMTVFWTSCDTYLESEDAFGVVAANLIWLVPKRAFSDDELDVFSDELTNRIHGEAFQ